MSCERPFPSGSAFIQPGAGISVFNVQILKKLKLCDRSLEKLTESLFVSFQKQKSDFTLRNSVLKVFKNVEPKNDSTMASLRPHSGNHFNKPVVSHMDMQALYLPSIERRKNKIKFLTSRSINVFGDSTLEIIVQNETEVGTTSCSGCCHLGKIRSRNPDTPIAENG